MAAIPLPWWEWTQAQPRAAENVPVVRTDVHPPPQREPVAPAALAAVATPVMPGKLVPLVRTVPWRRVSAITQ